MEKESLAKMLRGEAEKAFVGYQINFQFLSFRLSAKTIVFVFFISFFVINFFSLIFLVIPSSLAYGYHFYSQYVPLAINNRPEKLTVVGLNKASSEEVGEA